MFGQRDAQHFETVLQVKASAGLVDDRYVPGANQRVDKALQVLEPGARLLDLGCGTGIFASQAKVHYDQVFGVDIAESAVNIARQNGVIATVVNVNCERLPYADASLDVVSSLAVLQYVYDLDFVLVEIGRVLKPGGNLLISLPNMRTFWRMARLMLYGRFPTTSKDPVGYDGGTLHYFCFSDMKALLLRHGFCVRGAYGIFCLPAVAARLPDCGFAGKMKREFFSAEIFIWAKRGAV